MQKTLLSGSERKTRWQREQGKGSDEFDEDKGPKEQLLQKWQIGGVFREVLQRGQFQHQQHNKRVENKALRDVEDIGVVQEASEEEEEVIEPSPLH